MASQTMQTNLVTRTKRLLVINEWVNQEEWVEREKVERSRI